VRQNSEHQPLRAGRFDISYLCRHNYTGVIYLSKLSVLGLTVYFCIVNFVGT